MKGANLTEEVVEMSVAKQKLLQHRLRKSAGDNSSSFVQRRRGSGVHSSDLSLTKESPSTTDKHLNTSALCLRRVPVSAGQPPSNKKRPEMILTLRNRRGQGRCALCAAGLGDH